MSSKEKDNSDDGSKAKIRNYNEDEVKLFIKACEPYLAIISDRARSKLAEKNKAWDAIYTQFNLNADGYQVKNVLY